MLGFATEDRITSLAAALSYWVFRCRDNSSAANGLKTWEYMQSSIQNAATPSRSLSDYLVNLSLKLSVPTLKPNIWRQIVQPNQVVLRAAVSEDGSLGDLQQFNKDQALAYQDWEQLIHQWRIEYGITERHVLRVCLNRPQIVTLYVRLKHEEEKLNWQNNTQENQGDTIDV